MSPSLVFRFAWGLWLLSWLLAARWSSPAARQWEPRKSLRFNLPIVAGALLLLPSTTRQIRAAHFWNFHPALVWTCAILTVLFFLFTWWARVALGDLWSASITRKADHRVIDSGPYGITRHPIYTGMIGATLATALAEATWPALAGAALITFGLWLKARIEEQFLRSELGADAYDQYRRKVPMLVPFMPASR